MNRRNGLSRLSLSRKMLPTTGVDIEYYCRNCKGHYSRTVPVTSIREASCRCGSNDLLVYAVASEITSPLRTA